MARLPNGVWVALQIMSGIELAAQQGGEVK